MRFLCTDLFNGIRFEEFDHRDSYRKSRHHENKYAILSHRWGLKEVLLGEVLSPPLGKVGPVCVSIKCFTE